MSDSEFKKRLIKGLKAARKKAIETALLHKTTLITWENGKIKELVPTKKMLES